MVKLRQAIKNNKANIKMLLQIHDEVVFQVPASEIECEKLVIETMEKAVETTVPLLVEVAYGEDLFEVNDNA